MTRGTLSEPLCTLAFQKIRVPGEVFPHFQLFSAIYCFFLRKIQLTQTRDSCTQLRIQLSQLCISCACVWLQLSQRWLSLCYEVISHTLPIIYKDNCVGTQICGPQSCVLAAGLKCVGLTTDFSSKAILESYNLGSNSNISRIKSALQDKDMIDFDKDNVYLEDPVFKIWYKRNIK